MKSIVEYQDYRQYIQDFYKEQKNFYGLSWRIFAKRAGFVSASYLLLICEGKTNLSEDGIDKVAAALELAGFEKVYFRSLVHFNQAKHSDEKQKAFEEITEFGKKYKVRVLNEEMFSYFSSWLNPVLRELVPNITNPKPTEIKRRLYPKASASEIRNSLDFLVESGLLVRNPDGSYKQVDKTLSSGNKDVVSMALRSLHKQMGTFAVDALDNVPISERNVSELVLGLTQKAYNQIVEELAIFRKKVMAIAAADDDMDRVYGLNLQLFPLTHRNNAPRTPKDSESDAE